MSTRSGSFARRMLSPFVFVGYHVVSGGHPDWPATELLADIIGSGRSSRLYTRLVKQDKIAAQAGAGLGFLGSKYPSLIVVNAMVSTDATTDQVEAAIYEELARLAKEGPTPEELQKVKTPEQGLLHSRPALEYRSCVSAGPASGTVGRLAKALRLRGQPGSGHRGRRPAGGRGSPATRKPRGGRSQETHRDHQCRHRLRVGQDGLGRHHEVGGIDDANTRNTRGLCPGGDCAHMPFDGGGDRSRRSVGSTPTRSRSRNSTRSRRSSRNGSSWPTAWWSSSWRITNFPWWMCGR